MWTTLSARPLPMRSPPRDDAGHQIRPRADTWPTDPYQALERLYDEQAAPLHRFVHGMTGRREDADDVIQTLWLKLADDPTRLSTLSSPTAYLWTMARNQVRSLLRRQSLERFWTPSRDEDDEPPQCDDGSLSPEERQDLRRAVARLSARLRAVVLLVAFDGCTLEEAALRLDIPRGTVASRYHAAIQKLQHRLGGSR